MFIILARYKGKKRRKAEVVRESATAFSRMVPAEDIEVVGVEEFTLQVADPELAVGVCMALIAPGDWALALSYNTDATYCRRLLGNRANAGSVTVNFPGDPSGWANDIHASFALIAFVLQKRSAEGREATAMVRSGYSQIEAAETLGISKQAMSQRLQAAGWKAEQAGYAQAVSLLQRAQEEFQATT